MRDLYALIKRSLLILFLPLNIVFCQDSLIISEFMAINNKNIQDEDGTYSDWIEIHNGGSLPVNMEGWYLSDEAANFTKWPFPAITMNANEYIIVFASGKDRSASKDSLHANFKLSGAGEFLALSNPDSSWYSTVFSPEYPEQYDNISYTFHNGAYIYSSIPTPGFENDSGIFVSPPEFNMEHGFYNSPFKLALSSLQQNVDIYYTTDASTPDTSATLYTDSIHIDKTTVVRAVAISSDTSSSISVTCTYIFPEDVFSQTEDQPGYPDAWLQPSGYMEYFEMPTHYHMNQDVLNMGEVNNNIVASIKGLPIVSVVTDIDHLFSKSMHADSGGIYMYSGEPLGPTRNLTYHLGRGWERPASVEYFNSNEEDGSLDFQENCGLKIHGGASRSTHKTLKRSFKIGFKSKFGPTRLKEEVFGDDAPNQYDRLILRGSFAPRIYINDVVDPWVKSAMLDMGQYAARSKFVHLYLNGMYWGMYNLSEQLDANFMRDHLGGRDEDYDIMKDYDEIEAGDSVAWDQMIALAADPANYQILIGNHPDGTPDPSNEKLLNPENFIDYIIDMMYNDMGDWDHHNWVAARRRINSEGFHFFAWDAEAGLGNGNLGSFILGGGNENRPSGLFYDLMKNEEFRDLFISRVNKSFFEDGALTPEPGLNRYRFWLDQIDTAIIANQARWYANMGDIWDIEKHSRIDDYFSDRTENVFNQFINQGIYPRIDKPVFNSDDNYLPDDFELMMTAPEGAEIRYSVDGTDPGYYKLSSNSSIMVYDDQPIPLPAVGEQITILARSILDTLWSPLAVRSYTIEEEVSINPDNPIAKKGYIFNYPNPFIDQTDLKYYLSESSTISIKIYNMMGDHISTLENGIKQQGKHVVSWDAGNIPPGIYFCILENYSNAESYRVKMIKE